MRRKGQGTQYKTVNVFVNHSVTISNADSIGFYNWAAGTSRTVYKVQLRVNNEVVCEVACDLTTGDHNLSVIMDPEENLEFFLRHKSIFDDPNDLGRIQSMLESFLMMKSWLNEVNS